MSKMAQEKTTIGRRAFLKSTALAGGGMMLGFSWAAEACKTPSKTAALPGTPKDWVGINGYIKIAPDGMVTIMSPNPEIGQNVKTTMPMIVADELDVAWEQVVVEQADLNTEVFKRQLAGGSPVVLQQMERHARSRFDTHPGQALEGLHQSGQGMRIGHGSRFRKAVSCLGADLR